MSFNFFEQYQNYSNVQLLEITLQPEAYQQQAVEAADRILKGRQVSATEMAGAEASLRSREEQKQAQKEKADVFKTKARDIVEAVLQPAADVEPHKWLNIFLIAVGAQYLISLYFTLGDFFSFMRSQGYVKDPLAFVIYPAQILYMPVVFYLLLKRNRRGWVLLVIASVLTTLTAFTGLFMASKYQSMHSGQVAFYIFRALLNGGLLVFLLKKEVAVYFGISAGLKKRTITLIGVGIMLIIINAAYVHLRQ